MVCRASVTQQHVKSEKNDTKTLMHSPKTLTHPHENATRRAHVVLVVLATYPPPLDDMLSLVCYGVVHCVLVCRLEKMTGGASVTLVVYEGGLGSMTRRHLHSPCTCITRCIFMTKCRMHLAATCMTSV